MSFVPIKDVLIRVLKRRGLCNDEKLLRILSHWEAIAGERLSKFSIPQRLKGEILYVLIKDPAFIADFEFRKDVIIDSVREKLGISLKDLKFFVGS